MRISFILPSDIWEGLFRNGSVAFFVDKIDDLVSFWRDVGETHAGLQRHPVKEVDNYWKRAVPVVLHGDGAPVT